MDLKLNKNAQSESYSFLIGIIIFILLITPVILIIHHSMTKESQLEKSFNELYEKTLNLKDGEKGSTLIEGLDPSVLILSSNQKQRVYPGSMVFMPTTCYENQCLCICNLVAGGYFLVLSCLKEHGMCKKYPPNNLLYNSLIGGGSTTVTTAYYERKGRVISICDNPQTCFPKELEAATNTINNLYKTYTECLNIKDNDCICKDFSYDPNSFKIIRLKYDGENVSIHLLGDVIYKIYPYRNVVLNGLKIDSKSIMTYNPITNKTKEWLEFEIGPDADSKYEDFNFNNKVLFYKNKNNEITILYNKDGTGETLFANKRTCGEDEKSEIKVS